MLGDTTTRPKGHPHGGEELQAPYPGPAHSAGAREKKPQKSPPKAVHLRRAHLERYRVYPARVITSKM